MEHEKNDPIISLDTASPIWPHIFTVAPLVVIGSQELDGSYDMAPKHMAMPMGWANYFGFVCTPMHRTYHNIKRDGAFTVTYVRPSQIVLSSLAAASRSDGPGLKPAAHVLPTVPAEVVSGVFLKDGYVFLECELDRIVDDFGDNSLITGSIVAAHVHEDALRVSDGDDAAQLVKNPLLAYLHPGRYAEIVETDSFPYPSGFSR